MRAVFFIARLKAQDALGAFIVFEEDPLEGCLAVLKADKTIITTAGDKGGGKDDDIAFVIFGFRGIAADAGGEGVFIGEVGATQVVISEAAGIRKVGKFLGIAGRHCVDDRHGAAGHMADIAGGLLDDFVQDAGEIGGVEIETGFVGGGAAGAVFL